MTDKKIEHLPPHLGGIQYSIYYFWCPVHVFPYQLECPFCHPLEKKEQNSVAARHTKEGDKMTRRVVEAEARETYDKAIAFAEEAYLKARAPARKAYEKVEGEAQEAYEKAMVPAWEAYEKATAEALETYKKATALAREGEDD